MRIDWKNRTEIDEAKIVLQSSRGESALKDLLLMSKDVANVSAFLNADLARAECDRTRSWWGAVGADVTDLLVIGIGGSTLASRAVLDGARPKSAGANVRFLESVDTEVHEELGEYIKSIAPQTFFILVISKSGTTIEVMANLAFVERAFMRAHNIKPRVGVVTLGETLLAQRARKEQWPHLLSHPTIPDRYAAFTVTGLVPMYAAGVNIEQFCQSVDHNAFEDALATAAIRAISYHEGERVHDLFYFHPELEALGKWHRALMAESLGKAETIDGKPAHIALEPVVSVGTQDLHAVLQLRFGSGGGTFTTFVVDEQLLNPEGEVSAVLFQSIQETYASRKLPSMSYVLMNLSASELGRYMVHAMCETALLAYYFEVNPFDQPEVEEYKERARERLAEEGGAL